MQSLLGQENRRFVIKLPQALAALCGEETLEIREECEGLTTVEMTFWKAFYELKKEQEEKRSRSRSGKRM